MRIFDSLCQFLFVFSFRHIDRCDRENDMTSRGICVVLMLDLISPSTCTGTLGDASG